MHTVKVLLKVSVLFVALQLLEGYHLGPVLACRDLCVLADLSAGECFSHHVADVLHLVNARVLVV
jgi:hypothetical protein